MDINAEFLAAVYIIAAMVFTTIIVVCYQHKKRKAQEWAKRYGNTDFTNPYYY